MAATLYTNGKKNMLNGTVILTTDTIKVVLSDHTDDTPVPATDEFLSDISTAGAIEETSPALTSKDVTAGVFDAADVTFTATAGDACDSFTILEDTGSAATSALILFDDAASGLPVTLGGDVTITWDAGANKIFNWS